MRPIANSTAFQVHVEGTPRDLHPILRDEVYRITGESIRNAFRHADAKQIEVEIHYDDRRLRVRVRDDGKGIDPKLTERWWALKDTLACVACGKEPSS